MPKETPRNRLPIIEPPFRADISVHPDCRTKQHEVCIVLLISLCSARISSDSVDQSHHENNCPEQQTHSTHDETAPHFARSHKRSSRSINHPLGSSRLNY